MCRNHGFYLVNHCSDFAVFDLSSATGQPKARTNMSTFFFDEDMPRTALRPVPVQFDAGAGGMPQARGATPLGPFFPRRSAL